MKKAYLLFLVLFLMFSCKDDNPNGDIKESSEYESLVLGIPQAQIDSIRKSEEKKQVVLKKVSFKVDSANSVDLMLPISNYAKEYSFSGDINLTDPNSSAERSEDEIPASISIKNDFSDGDTAELIQIGKSSNPDIYPVSDIKEFNEIEKVLLETKNALLYVDDFGHKKMYYRQYNPANSSYYLYIADVPKYNDQKLQYAELFSIYKKAQNLLSFDKENQSQNLTWESVRPTLSTIELKNYEVYYKSLEKELKYFMKDNDSADIKKEHIQLYLYRDDDHSKHNFDQVTVLADSQYSGTFETMYFQSRLYQGFFKGIYEIDDPFKFIRKISDNSILMSATRKGYSSDDTSFYIISSIKTPKGRFYLISPTTENGNDVTALINTYFSKHLKI